MPQPTAREKDHLVATDTCCAAARSGRVGTLAWALACVVGCAAARPGPALTPTPAIAPASVLGSRWVRANRGAQIGPAVPGGTLVLLGGRRAVVAPDGTLHAETIAAPEALDEVVAVPTKRGPVVVGLAARNAYRFDDPLGPGVRLFEVWERVHVAGVRDGAIDVAQLQGGVKSFDALTGAVLGGCWSDVRTECPVPPHDEPSLAATVLPARSPALLHWIAATRADPLMLAVTDGAKLDDRTAVAASHGLVAVVDLASGGVREILHYDERRPADESQRSTCGFSSDCGARDEYLSCEVAHAGRELWFFCPWTGTPTREHDKQQMPLGVLRVDRGKTLTLKPVRAFTSVGRDAGHHLVRSSSAGGVLVSLPCSFDSIEALTQTCVRQPNDSFSSFFGAARAQLPNEAPPNSDRLPLADGRIAQLFGSYNQGRATGAPLQVVVLGPSGEVTEFPPLPIAFAEGSLVHARGIDEDDGGILIAFEAQDSAWIVRQPLNGAPAAVRQIRGAASVGLGGGHAIAVVNGDGGARIVISNDGGAHVFEEPGPGRLNRGLRVSANDVGAFLEDTYSHDGWLRVGWEPIEAQ